MSSPTSKTGIPFSFFVGLVEAISKINPRNASEKQLRNTRYTDASAYKTFKGWVLALRERYSPLPADTTAIVFRLLFPDEDVQRKYGLQETRLAQHLIKIIGVSADSHGRGERLKNWKGEDTLGCLGDEIAAVMSGTSNSQASAVTATLDRIDTLLAELAAKSAYSAPPVHASFSMMATPRCTRDAILTDLYTSLTPAEASVLTQIILKDLRPLLYPIPHSAIHYTAALLQYKSNAVAMLTKGAAMHAWDPSGRMALIYRSKANLEQAARTFERLQPGDSLPTPEFGIPIQIPKCVKGQGTAQSLRTLREADKVWVETKYDGERAQIHVRLGEDGVPHIKIFSKSGRDSTLDRAGIHGITYDALGISQPTATADEGTVQATKEPTFKHTIIIEAEMVAFSDILGRIDEFWRIRSLVASTAVGVRHKSPQPAPPSTGDASESQCSLVSNASDGGTRHLALVFFDVLLLDGVSLLSLPYSERRAVLEQVVQVIPGHAMLAERAAIDMTRTDADGTLRKTFAALIADHQEGAVLKADGALYGERERPWVKLKRDYIPGYGDAVDLILVAASWEKERARELRVPPTAYTTFHFGALANSEALKADPSCRPHIEVIFTSSYGLSREKLEELNFMIKSSETVSCRGPVSSALPYSYKLVPTLTPPMVFLRQPLLAELFGAGFTKVQSTLFYELRFPRISKVYRPSDRPWVDGVSLMEFQQIAHVAVGRDRPGKAEDDWVRGVFRPEQPASPGARCPKKRKQTESLWIEKLEAIDGKTSGKGSPTKRARTTTVGPNRKAADVADAENAENACNTEKHKIGLTRLCSVTNLAASPSVPLRHTSTYIAPSSPAIPKHLSHPSKKSSQQGSSNTPQSAPQPTHEMRLSPTPRPLPNAADVVNSENLIPVTASPDDVLVCGSTTSPPRTLHQFLQDSVVWFARSSGSSRPLWRAPSHAVIPTGSRFNTLDAALLACGWDEAPPCDWAIRGVIFVEDSQGVQTFMDRTLGELTRRRAALLDGERLTTSRPIYVFSAKMLAYDVLDKTMTTEELESRALCRFG